MPSTLPFAGGPSGARPKRLSTRSTYERGASNANHSPISFDAAYTLRGFGESSSTYGRSPVPSNTKSVPQWTSTALAVAAARARFRTAMALVRSASMRMIFGSVDRVVRGAVDDRVWCRSTERRLHRLGVIDVQIAVTKGHDLVIAAKLMDDGRAELTAGAYDDDAHVMVEALMRRWRGRTRQSPRRRSAAAPASARRRWESRGSRAAARSAFGKSPAR